MNSATLIWTAILAVSGLAGSTAQAAEKVPGAAEFHKDIRPVLETFCFDCHADGANKGGVAFDEFKSDQAVLQNRELWSKALKNLRAGLMPPAKKPRPTSEQQEQIAHWIKSAVFAIDPQDPDPGRVTVRRLNRVEYRNTIRDLLGVDFDTQMEFPPDDTGYGFDNIGDVLTMSPMLLEKYVDAAKSIVSKAVPMVPAVPSEKLIPGGSFARVDPGGATNAALVVPHAATGSPDGALSLSYYERASAATSARAPHAGRYQLALDLRASERYVDNQFDYNKCRLVFKADGKELLAQEFVREGGKLFHFEFDQNWPAGEHALTFELQPLTPDQGQVRMLTLRIISVTLRGPLEEKYWVKPKDYERTFPREVPGSASSRRAYAREILGPFARRAFRGPVDDQTVNRLATLAETFYTQPGHTFEAGVAQAMVAALASPRFLFREEGIEPDPASKTFPFVDEYALASRLSYFLWSSMPDEELLRLAGEKKLKANLGAQVKRMLADPRSDALVQNFVGQWLQARDIETVQINARAVLARDDGTPAGGRGGGRGARGNGGFFRRPRADLTPELRKDMRHETEMYFAGIVKEDRSVLELIESDYTFLNARLATHYGLTNLTVNGDELRRVTLPPDSPRGGILTQGTILGVTSNPTRTSPVKRGLFILDSILGTPPLPPPPNIPPLEDAATGITNHTPTLRETLALHREKPLCSSCHDRMDPPGLALENFNAMGMWRDKELAQPIEAGGKLVTGEEFTSIQEMKHILATKHNLDFYRTLTGKLLTYALGRGLDYYDVETVDQIVARMDKENGHFSALLMGVVESAPFQKRRNQTVRTAAAEARHLDNTLQRGADGEVRHETISTDVHTRLKSDANEMAILVGERNGIRK